MPDNIELTPEVIREFLKDTPPFTMLDPITIDGVVARCGIERQPAGTTILVRGKSEVTHFRLVYKGQVKVFLKDEQGGIGLEVLRGPGEAVGHLAILRGSLSNLEVVTTKDTVCLTLARQDFLQLVRSNLGFSNFYLTALSDGYISKALDKLERPRRESVSEGSLYLFSAQVGDVVRRRPVTIDGHETIQAAAHRMSEKRVGYLLVTNSNGDIKGIVTDRDMRTKVVATDVDHQLAVEKIMTTPIQTIPSHTVCFDALLEMMKQRVHHLAIETADRIVGVISGHDLMVVQGSSPLYLVREIQAQKDIEGLYDIALQSPRVVRSLIYEGAKPRHITRVITLINDYILGRLLTLLQDSLGEPPVPYCWLLMGSEGRREQTFRTDQDNGLIFRDPETEAERKAAEEYFEVFAEEAVSDLVACGVPRCKGGIMASNPKWRQPYSIWRKYFDHWIRQPEPQEVLNATIFFDFRPGFGDLSLGERLRDHLMGQLHGQDVFLHFLARDCLNTPPAINFLRQFNLEKSEPHKNKLDIKTKGITPFVDFGRLMALKFGIKETNTLERMDLLFQGGHISEEFYQQASQAYEFQMQLRLLHQQRMDDEALEPDNYIDPENLSDMNRRTLKDSFGVINDIKAFIKDEFHLQ
jgi:CBS domain-containing protein